VPVLVAVLTVLVVAAATQMARTRRARNRRRQLMMMTILHEFTFPTTMMVIRMTMKNGKKARGM
jgi:hypothetical protein